MRIAIVSGKDEGTTKLNAFGNAGKPSTTKVKNISSCISSVVYLKGDM